MNKEIKNIGNDFEVVSSIDFTKESGYRSYMDMRALFRESLELDYDYDDNTQFYWSETEIGGVNFWSEPPTSIRQLEDPEYCVEEARNIRRIGDFMIVYGYDGCGSSYDFIFSISKEVKEKDY